MNSSVVVVVGGLIAIVQLGGLYFTSFAYASSDAWIRGVAAVLYLNSYIVPFFAFLIYLTLYAVNLTYNLLGMVLLIALVQYVFTIYFGAPPNPP